MPVVAYWNGLYVNPTEAHLPMDERGHQFGDGVYEVVRVYGGRPFLLDLHLERLAQSLKAIGIENPHTMDQWRGLIHQSIEMSGELESLVYWQVTRGIAPRGHMFPDAAPSVSLTVRPFLSKQSPTATLLALPDERWANVFIKTLNLLPNVLAKEAAARSGATEALLVREGRVTEGSSSNAWFVIGKEVWTHPANRWILNGISRRFTLKLAEQLGYSVVERPVSWRDLGMVKEVFMTGTTVEVLPIDEIRVPATLETQFMRLPDEGTATFSGQYPDSRTAWKNTSGFPVAERLRQAYADEVARFRL